MNYFEIRVVAEKAALATQLPIKLALVYLNCTKWEIKHYETHTVPGREYCAVVDIADSDNPSKVECDISRQLLGGLL